MTTAVASVGSKEGLLIECGTWCLLIDSPDVGSEEVSINRMQCLLIDPPDVGSEEVSVGLDRRRTGLVLGVAMAQLAVLLIDTGE
jgi:hypothetical protein